MRNARIATAEIAIASQLIVGRADTQRRVVGQPNFNWAKEDPKVKIGRSSQINIILSDRTVTNAVPAIAAIVRAIVLAIAGLFAVVRLGLAPTAAGASDHLNAAVRLRSHRMRRTSHRASQQAKRED